MIMVKLFANLRKIAGTKEVLVDLKEGMGSETGTNLGEVISALVRQIPALSQHLIENGKIRPHVIITINGHPTQAMDAGVTEQDQIAIFPPIAGG